MGINRTKQKKNTDIREGDDTDFADLAQYFHGGGVFSIVLVNQGSIGARLLCVFARRARRANRAQSTAQH